MLLKRGAEAELRTVEWRGRSAVEKIRLPKAYRHATLDDELRRSRLRAEVRLLAEVRKLGISVPIVYDVDLRSHRIVMEFVEGPTAKQLLEEGGADARTIARAIGRLSGTLHAQGIVHGDLTTSNMLWRDGRICLIDLSMGEKTDERELQGVDLRLLNEAWTSAHFAVLELFNEVIAGYRETFPRADGALAKMREIEERGRYT